MKNTLLFFLIAMGLCACTKGTLEYTYADGTVREVSVKGTKHLDGTVRYRVKKEQIDTAAVTMSIIAEELCSLSAGPDTLGSYWLMGDGSWGRFDRDSGQAVIKRSRLALLGAKCGDKAYVGIMKTLRCEFDEVVRSSSDGYAIFPRYRIQDMECVPYEDAVFDVYSLRGDDANYSGMARTYRKWQLDRGEVRPLSEKVKGNDALKWSTESIFVRYKFGRTPRKGMNHALFATYRPPMCVDHTFDDFMDFLRRAKEAGIDYADMCMVGWQPGGHDGAFPDLFPPDERFGGEEKMKEAIALGKSLGYRMGVHVNWHNYYKTAERYNPDDACKGIDGTPRNYWLLPAGQSCFCCWEVMNRKYVDEDMSKLLSYGINGILHHDVTSAENPTPCHDSSHPNNRGDMVRWENEIGRKCRERFGGSSSEAGLDHIASSLDNILYCIWRPNKDMKEGREMADGIFPIWPIAYNGIIMSQPFYATIDASCPRSEGEVFSEAFADYLWIPTPEERMLKVFEWGGRPAFYYNDYKDLTPIKRMYDAWQPLKHLQLEYIHDHEILSPGVSVTRYENGEEVVCNATDSAFEYKGKQIPPKDYALLQ